MLHLVFSPTTPVAGQHVLHLLLGGGKRLNEFHFCDDPIRLLVLAMLPHASE